MKVEFDGPGPVYHPATGLDLVPGEFEVADEKGAQLVEAGLVRVVGDVIEVPGGVRVHEAAPSELVQPAPAAARTRKGKE